MDGHRLWGREPDGLRRTARGGTDWGLRMQALGNAVVPQQAYPVLKSMADIERGKCRGTCALMAAEESREGGQRNEHGKIKGRI